MERLKPPSELDIDSLNLADVWKEWKEAWELYRISSGLHEKDDAIQIATIQSVLGTKARWVLKTLPNNFPNSPNQMLFSRQIRKKVPVHPFVLVPQICHNVPELLEKRQGKYKEFYDRQGSKQLPQLKEGDSVRFKKPGPGCSKTRLS